MYTGLEEAPDGHVRMAAYSPRLFMKPVVKFVCKMINEIWGPDTFACWGGSTFDEVIIAAGIIPRKPEIEGIDHPKVLNYLEVLCDKKAVGKQVAVMGAGGISFDVSAFLIHDPEHISASLDILTFMAQWGVASIPKSIKPPARDVFYYSVKRAR